MSLADSHPCPARCPICGERCWSAEGHTECATAPKGFASLHSCRKHVWGTHSQNAEAQRAQYKATRRELIDEIEHASDQAGRRLRKAVGLVRQ